MTFELLSIFINRNHCVLKWIRRNIKKTELKNLDNNVLNDKNANSYWSSFVNSKMSDNPIELTIELENRTEPSDEQTLLLEEFEANWPTTKQIILEHIVKSFKGTKWEKKKEEIDQMYFLIGLDLKRDNLEWWIVFEPEFHVPTIFNFFLRFTFKNNEITWSNI